MDKFISDASRIYKEKGNCIAVVSEGIHYADGSFVSEAKTSATDGFVTPTGRPGLPALLRHQGEDRR